MSAAMLSNRTRFTSLMKLIQNFAAILLLATGISIGPVAYAQTPVAPDVVLISNSRVKVTYEDLIAEIARLPADSRLEFLLNPTRLATSLENILIGKIMSAEAQQSGLHKQANAVAEIRNQTEKVLSKYRREELEATAPKIDLVPLAREIYLTRTKGLERPALYTSWHTLIKSKDRTREAAKERAKVVKEKIDAGGQLETIAKEYSNDESVTLNNGFIRPTPLSYLDRGFAEALEKLKVGESTIVETEYGFHVVRLLKMQPAVRPSFDEVKAEMLAQADKTYKQTIVDKYLASIRDDPTLKLHTEVLDQVRPKLPEIPPPPAPSAPTRPF